MPKEWVLNMATNRWGLNKQKSVGPTSKWIRECDPKAVEDWEKFYFNKLKNFLANKKIPLSSKEYLEDLGRKLYTKITEVLQSEIEEIKESDCIEYIHNLVINRTFEGYQREISTIYGRLEQELEISIKAAPDEWDRLYNVDFYIKIGKKYIGLQIKPITYEQTPEIYKWKEWLAKSYEKFEKKYGGKVFTIFSISKGREKIIYNNEIIKEIKEEIHNLQLENL